jgi:predicted SAM-dependent methyltransferase
MIKLAKESFPYIEFVKEDMRYLSNRYYPLDGILASYSLIHLPKDQSRSTLASLYRLLKPADTIFVSIQSGDSQEGYFAHPLIPGEKLFLKIFSEKEITDLVQDCGSSI